MSRALPEQPAEVFRRRHAALRAELGDHSALIFAGGYKPMNYPANIYPYRADSHFLYLTGAALPDASVLVSGERAELFLEPTPDDDALWHGEVESWDEIAARIGVDAIRDVAELPDAIQAAGGPEKVGTLPSTDPLTRIRQSSALTRPWSAADLSPALVGADGAVADAMIALRLVHDAAAIEKMREAARTTAEAHVVGMKVTRPGIFEHEVHGAMEAVLLARGMRASYPPIVTVHGEVLHNTHYHHQLRDGDLLLVDLGADNMGWAGDVTRTWPVNGKYSPTQKAMYELVLQAEVDAIAMVRPGARYRDIHLAAARTLMQGFVDEGIFVGDVDGLVERGAHALFFPHGTGHLIGLDVHDMEDLGDRAGYAPGRTRSQQFGLCYLRLDRDLQPGMAVTIEPGFYQVPAILDKEELVAPFVADGSFKREALAKFADIRGIRIEDDVLCTDGEPEVLSAAIPKTVSDIEAVVGSGV